MVNYSLKILQKSYSFANFVKLTQKSKFTYFFQIESLSQKDFNKFKQDLKKNGCELLKLNHKIASLEILKLNDSWKKSALKGNVFMLFSDKKDFINLKLALENYNAISLGVLIGTQWISWDTYISCLPYNSDLSTRALSTTALLTQNKTQLLSWINNKCQDKKSTPITE